MAENLIDISKQAIDAYKSRDMRTLVGFYGEDAELVFPGREPMRGRKAIETFWEEDREAFPTVSVNVIWMAEANSKVCTEWEVSGKNSGTLTGPGGMKIPATGKSINQRGVDTAEFRGDKVVKHCFYFDSAAFLTQLGLVPQAAPGAGQ